MINSALVGYSSVESWALAQTCVKAFDVHLLASSATLYDLKFRRYVHSLVLLSITWTAGSLLWLRKMNARCIWTNGSQLTWPRVGLLHVYDISKRVLRVPFNQQKSINLAPSITCVWYIKESDRVPFPMDWSIRQAPTQSSLRLHTTKYLHIRARTLINVLVTLQ